MPKNGKYEVIGALQRGEKGIFVEERNIQQKCSDCEYERVTKHRNDWSWMMGFCKATGDELSIGNHKFRPPKSCPFINKEEREGDYI